LNKENKISAIENILDKHKKNSAVMHNDNSFNIIYNLDYCTKLENTKKYGGMRYEF